MFRPFFIFMHSQCCKLESSNLPSPNSYRVKKTLRSVTNLSKQYLFSPYRSTVRLAQSSKAQRSTSSVDSRSSNKLAVMHALPTLTMSPLNQHAALRTVKMHWRTSSLREPRASSRNAHWTLTWPRLHAASQTPSQRKSSHRSAHWSQKPVARRRRSWSHSSQSSVWSSLSSPHSPSLHFSELHWSPRRLWSSQSSLLSSRNSCSSRNCCRREANRNMVAHRAVFSTLSTALAPTASLLSPSPMLDTSSTKATTHHPQHHINNSQQDQYRRKKAAIIIAKSLPVL